MLAPSEYERDAVRGYLDTATYGLPSRSVVAAVERALADWRSRADWRAWEADAEAARAVFAELVGADVDHVAATTSVSAAAGVVAASLPAGNGDNVVLHEDDFASAIYPWTNLGRRGVEIRALPLEHLADGIDQRTILVALSSVQSADGRVADLTVLNGHVWGLAADVSERDRFPRVFVDATQAVGAVPTNVDAVDYLACSLYKWIPAPRGLSFLYVRPERLDEVVPWLAGWKSGGGWAGKYYGLPPELAGDARRLDTSLSWIAAAGARPALELIRDVGVADIAAHDLRLARRFAAELGLPRPDAPIVRLAVEDADAAVDRLERAGVTASARAGAVRLSFHLYNDDEDVDLALEALAPVTASAESTSHA